MVDTFTLTTPKDEMGLNQGTVNKHQTLTVGWGLEGQSPMIFLSLSRVKGDTMGPWIGLEPGKALAVAKMLQDAVESLAEDTSK